MARATEQQIAEWKEQYVDIFEIKVLDKFGYLKTPDRKTAGFAASAASNPVRSNEILLKGCWIGGDDCIKDDDRYFMTAQGMLAPIMQAAEAEIKKL